MLLRDPLLKYGQRSAVAKIPVAMALLAGGLMLMGVSIAWWKSAFSLGHLGPGGNDFARGFLVGLAIVMEVAALVVALSAVAAQKKAAEAERAPRS